MANRIKVIQLRFTEGKAIHDTLWEGEVGSIQFRNHDNTIGRPSWVNINETHNGDHSITVCFPTPNNILIEYDKENDTLWCLSAITPEQLEQIKEQNSREKIPS